MTFTLPSVFPVHNPVCYGCVCTQMHQWSILRHQERRCQAPTHNELLFEALCLHLRKIFSGVRDTLNVKNDLQFKMICYNLSTKVKSTLRFMYSPFSCMTLLPVFYEDLFQLFERWEKKKWCNTQNTYGKNREQSALHGSLEQEEDGGEPRSSPWYCHCVDPLVLL